MASSQAITAGPVVRLGDRPPVRVLARLTLGSQAIRLVWAESSGAVTRILTRALTREFEAVSPAPQVLFERAVPLLALEMDPLDEGRAPGFVHALLGPQGDDPAAQRLAYLRIPLDATAGAAQRWVFAAPNPPARAYAISGGTAGGHVVLAQVGDEVWRMAAAGSVGWQVHIAHAAGLAHLRLASSPQGYWAALGVDTANGVVCVQDPDFSHER